MDGSKYDRGVVFFGVEAGVMVALALPRIEEASVATDAVAAVPIDSPEDNEKALRRMELAGAILITSDQLDIIEEE